jgi:ABC-2 type transport system permease protein
MLRLSLRQMAGRRRLLLLVALAAIPVVLAVILNAFLSDEEDFNEGFTNLIIDGLLISAIMPIVVMTLATSAFGNEVEDRTLNVLMLKPVSRYAIVFPKLLGSVLVAGPLMAGAGVIVAVIALGDGGVRALLAVGLSLTAGVVAYAAMFTWAGLISSKALAFALVYVFLWESLLTSFFSGIRFLSIRGYALGILNGVDGVTFVSIENRVVGLTTAIVGTVLVTVVFGLLTVRRLQRMDVQ